MCDGDDEPGLVDELVPGVAAVADDVVVAVEDGQAHHHGLPAHDRAGRRGQFTSYHQPLNRVRWQSAAMTRRLLGLIISRLVPDGPVVIGVDDTIERRWGRMIKARGIYRDPVRSSHGHFVKASGLRWLSFMVLTPVPWATCVKALPVQTILAPSERADHQCGRRHKLLTDWARQGMLQLCRWLPGCSTVFVGDSSFAVHELAYAVSGRATLISRLRLDANLFAPPPRRQA